MMGSFYSRSGRLVLEFRYRGIRCRETTKLIDSAANRKRARAILDRMEAEIMLGTFDYAKYFPKSKKAEQFADHDQKVDRLRSQLPKFSEFAKSWYSEFEVEWRQSYKDTVSLTLRKYLLPQFGDCPLDKIAKADILQFRAGLKRKPRANGTYGLSAARINKVLMILGQVLKEAAERYDFVSPCLNIRPLKVQKKHIQPFSLDEVQRMIAAVRPDFESYFTCRFFTGMRTGEIDGLKWKYVDFERREILVRETWVQGRAEYTKNDGSQREIQMSQPVYEALKAQYEVTGHLSYVFCNSTGHPLCNRNFTKRVWYPLLRYLGLEKRRPYETRHTAATLWLAAGEAPEWIARQMGHSTTEMLFTVYSRYVPNLTRQDGSAFDQLLSGRFPTALPDNQRNGYVDPQNEGSGDQGTEVRDDR